MRLYIATPITSRAEITFGDKYNAAAERVQYLKARLAGDFIKLGITETISTFDINPLGFVDEARAMGRCVEAVIDSDAILMDEGSGKSRGCTIEYFTARMYGKKLYQVGGNQMKPMVLQGPIEVY